MNRNVDSLNARIEEVSENLENLADKVKDEVILLMMPSWLSKTDIWSSLLSIRKNKKNGTCFFNFNRFFLLFWGMIALVSP